MREHLVPMLAGELIAAGVTVDPAAKNLLAGRILTRGERDFEQMQREIGIDLTRFKRPCIRSLGTGAALTEFAIARVPLTDEERVTVTALGGLAILMVSAFDAALDGGAQVPNLFPRDGKSPRRGTRPNSWIRNLVDLYFKRLAALPQTRPQLVRMVEKAIRRMYEAELQSVSHHAVGRRVWWRKNVLPFTVLGIPAWMAASSFATADFHRHVVWLCRLGEFFGWVDDCVDYAEDLATAQANRIDIRLQSMPQSRLVRNIASQASRILSQWDALNPTSLARGYFAVILWSWIEHKPEHASS